MITTYPEMNAQIVGILRISDAPDKRYAAQRIEELETALRFYADRENWANDTVDIGVGGQVIPDSSACALDNGTLARQSLGEETT